MPESIDWSQATFEANRLRQHEAFRALPFREKLERLEQMNEVVRWFATKNTVIDHERDQNSPSRQSG